MRTPDPRPAGETVDLDGIEAQAAHAQSIITALCSGNRSWTMSVPARPDYDPDLVLSAALGRIPALVTEVRHLRALLADAPAVWVATDDVGQPDRHSRIWAAEPVLARGRIFLSPDDVPTTPCMAMDSQIVPPGTCVRYRLVPDPEETP